MKNFFKSFSHPWLMFFMQIYSLGMFALFMLFVYIPYKSIDVDLFPFYIYKISINAVWYYAIIYLCIWIFVQLRLSVLNRMKDNFTFPQLAFFDFVMGTFGIPMFFIPGASVFGGLALEFALLLFVIDWMWLYKQRLNFIHVVVVLMVFVSIVLLFVNWQNDKAQREGATELVSLFRNNDKWTLTDDMWAVALYSDGQLVRQAGGFRYPEFYNVSLPEEGFNKVIFREYDSHYLYRYGSDIYVASRPSWNPIFRYIVNFSHIFSVYLFLTVIVLFVLSRMNLVYSLKKTLFSRLQYTLLAFMLICMLLVLVLVSLYTGSKYGRMSRNTHYYRTDLFLNYMNPIVEEYGDNPEVIHTKLKRIAGVLNTDIVLYDSDGSLFMKSDSTMNVVCYNIDDLRGSPFACMPTSIYVKMIRYNKEVLMISYTILFRSDHSPIYAILFTNMDRAVFDNEVSSFIILVMNIYFLVMIFCIVVSYFVSKRFSAPLLEIEAKMKNMRLRGNKEKIDYEFTRDDALSQLVTQYNMQVDKLNEAAEQIAQAERTESWYVIARQIAHEIRNPLTPMKLLVQNIKERKFEDKESYMADVRQTADIIMTCIDSIDTITGQLSYYARASAAVPVPTNLNNKIYDVVMLFNNNEKGVKVKFNKPSEIVMAMVDGDLVVQVFSNLIKNAIQSIPDERKGMVYVDMYCDDAFAHVSVKDNGCGIPKDMIENVFNVSFTTKIKGMGLGLAVVKNVVMKSGGDIKVESVYGEGSVFTASFPLLK